MFGGPRKKTKKTWLFETDYQNTLPNTNKVKGQNHRQTYLNLPAEIAAKKVVLDHNPQPPSSDDVLIKQPLAKSSVLAFIKIGFHPNYVCFSIP